MAEANENAVPITVEDAQSFLSSYGFENMEQAKVALDTYKKDIKDLKGRSASASQTEKELNTLKLAQEEARKLELTELDRTKESLVERENAIVTLQNEMANLKKDMVFKEVMFSHMKDKALTATRSKLYTIAVKSNDWADANELQEILTQVDTDFDAELASVNIKLPAPGDGDSTSRTGDSKYSPDYFKELNKKY